MQLEEYHNNHGRGRNYSCDNLECKNYNRKIGRSRGFWSANIICPICHKEGLRHSYDCGVSKGGIMFCNCHLHEYYDECCCKFCLDRKYNKRK